MARSTLYYITEVPSFPHKLRLSALLYSKPYFCRMQIPDIILKVMFYLLCTAVGVQVFYYLFFYSRLAFYKEKQRTDSVEQPVSIVICARNEAGKLVSNLPGVLVQDYKTTHEIVLVNDNSEDETKYLIEEFRKSFKNLIPVNLTQEAKLIVGKKFPLSMGIKSAKFETILLTDADCVPASEFWIQKMQGAYTDSIEIVLGYGAYHHKKGLLNKIIRFETFFSALNYLSFAIAGMPYMGVGRNLSYKREVFIRNKGFSSINQLPGGDDDLFINQVATKKNTTVVIDPLAHTLSEPKKTFGGWVKQKYRHYSTSKYYKPQHKILLGMQSFSLFALYPLLAFNLIFCNWWIALAVYGVRLLIQALVYYKAMKKLNEADLFPYFILFDIGLFFYYIFFLPAIWKKPHKTWD